MSGTAGGDGHHARGGPEETRGHTSTTDGSSFTEAIDRVTGCIRASGRLDVRAAELLSGTVEALRQGGCARVVLDLGGVQAADDAGLDVVHSLERRVAADGGHVTVLNRPGPGTD